MSSPFSPRTDSSQLFNNERGFTLVEMMVYMVIAGMLLATSVLAFTTQNKSYNRQDVVAEIQQNIRGSTNFMVSDVRFAGMGLTGGSDLAFEQADTDQIAVNYWADPEDYWSNIDHDGNDLNEEEITVSYRLDGTNLQRAIAPMGSTPGGWSTMAENIEYFRLEYLLNNDQTTPEGDWEWLGDVDESDDDQMEKIRAVKIIILGSARDAAFNPTDPSTYRPPFEEIDALPVNWVPSAGTGYKRMMSVVAQARNNRE